MQKTRLPLVMLLGLVALALLSGCADAAPTPAEAMREAEAAVPAAVTVTAADLRPTPTPTPEPTATPTPTPTPTPEATPTPDAEAKAQQDLQELQQAFAQIVEQYPEGYTETFGVRGHHTMLGGELGLGRAIYAVVEDIIQALDPSLELWSQYQLYLRKHPDSKLVIVFETNRAVWCRDKWLESTCQFTEQPIKAVAIAEWFAGRPIVRKAYALNPYTEQVAKQADDWLVELISGSLPFWERDRKGYWTEWQAAIFVANKSGEVKPLVGFQGKTRSIGANEGDGILEGSFQIFVPKEVDAERVRDIIYQDDKK